MGLISWLVHRLVGSVKLIGILVFLYGLAAVFIGGPDPLTLVVYGLLIAMPLTFLLQIYTRGLFGSPN
jgi:hypothetical protein